MGQAVGACLSKTHRQPFPLLASTSDIVGLASRSSAHAGASWWSLRHAKAIAKAQPARRCRRGEAAARAD